MCDIEGFEIVEDHVTVEIEVAKACVHHIDGARVFVDAVKEALANVFDLGEGKVVTGEAHHADYERIILTIAAVPRRGAPIGASVADYRFRTMLCRRIGFSFAKLRSERYQELVAEPGQEQERALF